MGDPNFNDKCNFPTQTRLNVTVHVPRDTVAILTHLNGSPWPACDHKLTINLIQSCTVNSSSRGLHGWHNSDAHNIHSDSQ